MKSVCSPGIAGDEPFVMAAIRDVTERKQAEVKSESQSCGKRGSPREIHHRVKNNLNVVSSLLGLQAYNIKDPTLSEAFRESQNRVVSMALIHEKLYQSQNLGEIDFEQYVKAFIPSLYHSYGIDQKQVRRSGRNSQCQIRY